MEAVVVDAGTKLLKAGFAVPDQPPSMVISFFRPLPMLFPVKVVPVTVNSSFKC